jgi:hypothetical protein
MVLSIGKTLAKHHHSNTTVLQDDVYGWSAQLRETRGHQVSGLPLAQEIQSEMKIRSFNFKACRKTLLRIWVFALSLGIFLAGASHLRGQALGGITGTATDTSGSVIGRANVIVSNEATGITATAATTATAGTFSLYGLQPGSYTIQVECPGFSRYVRQHILVEVSSTSVVNVTMSPGATSETVQVSANLIGLESTQPQLGTTIEPAVLNALPIEISGNARQIDQFIFLSPGVQGNTFTHQIGGGINFQNEVIFNGIPLVLPNLQGTQTYVNPPYELVNEFKVQRAAFSAQYGLGQGAVTYNMASGTNRLHGDIFEINRNSFFDSDGFFPSNFDRNGKPRPPVDHQNDYGFTVGGPLSIPHIYNGKDRTFFLFTSDWYRQNQALTGIGTVPTAAQKNGDFSSFRDSSGKLIPIYDPTTGLPFPGNIIPQSRFSALAKSILPSIPDPDRAGTVFGQQSNKSPAVTSSPIMENLYGFTLDHNLNASQSLHFTFWRDNQITQAFAQAPIVPISNPLESESNNYNYATGYLLNYVKTITPNLLATAGASWVSKLDGQANGRQNAPFAGVASSTVFPAVTFNGQNAPTNWGVNNGLTRNADRQLGISIVNNWLWTKGRHTLNIGGEFRRGYENQQSCTRCGGEFDFSQAQTSTPDSSDPNFGSYGSAFASFLLGEVNSASRQYALNMKLRNLAISPYIQDDIKVNSKLTVNAGLRWDIMVPFTEANNNIVFMNPGVPDPGAGNIAGGATKFGHCDGCAGYDRADTHWRYFGPRLGVAYMINDKTVVQAGGFISFLQGGAYEFGTANVASAMANLLVGEYNRSGTGSNIPGYGNWDSMQMPSPTATPFTPSIGNGNSINYFDRKRGMAPYDEAWNVTIQREIPGNTILELSYVANRAVHLPSNLNPINQPSPSILQYGSLLSQPITSPAAVAAGIHSPYPNFVNDFGGGATVFQALRPFPQYSNVQNLYDLTGSFFYNSLQAQAQKRFSNGLSYLSSLTLARGLSNSDRLFAAYFNTPLNKYDQRPEYSVSNNDQKYQVKLVGTYQLPAGKGQRFFNNSGFTGQLLGGWQISAILNYQGGTPFGPNESYTGLNGFNRPLAVLGAHISTASYSRVKDYFVGKLASPPKIFTTDAFTPTTSQYQLGDTARNYASLRSAPYRDEDISLMKRFSFHENVNASLRMDYFNAFNRTRFNGPDTNILDSTFGEVTSQGSSLINRQGQITLRVQF